MMEAIAKDFSQLLVPADYFPERQLAIARRQLAESADAARRACDEFAVVDTQTARLETVRIARARMQMAVAMQRRLEIAVRRLEERVGSRPHPTGEEPPTDV